MDKDTILKTGAGIIIGGALAAGLLASVDNQQEIDPAILEKAEQLEQIKKDNMDILRGKIDGSADPSVAEQLQSAREVNDRFLEFIRNNQ